MQSAAWLTDNNNEFISTWSWRLQPKTQIIKSFFKEILKYLQSFIFLQDVIKIAIQKWLELVIPWFQLQLFGSTCIKN